MHTNHRTGANDMTKSNENTVKRNRDTQDDIQEFSKRWHADSAEPPNDTKVMQGPSLLSKEDKHPSETAFASHMKEIIGEKQSQDFDLRDTYSRRSLFKCRFRGTILQAPGSTGEWKDEV